MKSQPLVSIITPTYNHEKFIEKCIESVLVQTYPHWEQIIIDDGSTDLTGELVAQFKDDRIKYVKQNNVGIWRLSETYNKALELSQGELIAILEGDDFWPADKLEKQVFMFEKTSVILSWGRVDTVNEADELISVGLRNPTRFKTGTKCEMLRNLILSNFIPACTVMVRKNILLSIGGFKQPEYAPFVDYLTWLELCLIGEFYPIDELMGYWRQHKTQITTVQSINMNKATTRVSVDFLERLPQALKEQTGISIDKLLKVQETRIANHVFISGRRALIKGEWVEGIKNFKEALQKGSWLIKAQSILGLICTLCKADLEWVYTILHRPHLQSGDEWVSTFSSKQQSFILTKIQNMGYKYAYRLFDFCILLKKKIIHILRR